MRFVSSKLSGLAAALGTAILTLAMTGCRSFWIDADIDNQTGETIHELEVDYPTASFGKNALEPGQSMHYRFQIRGAGPVKVEYTLMNGKVIHAQGITLAERQRGYLQVRLMPQGKVEFLPKLESVP